MKILIQIMLLHIGININAQIPHQFLSNFLIEGELIVENSLTELMIHDFRDVWLTKNNEVVYGIIGEDHERIHVKFLSIIKNPYNETEYIVYGKTMVKENICEFSGVIKIVEIKRIKEFHYGVDDKYKDSEISSQGILKAQYSFSEFEEQSHSGKFTGDLISKWYIDKNDQINYDDIQSIADGYTNNAFIGTWTNYTNGKSKKCNWADYRVPLAKGGFDIGAGEFSVSKNYWNKGWLDLVLKNKAHNLAIEPANKSIESKAWWE